MNQELHLRNLRILAFALLLAAPVAAQQRIILPSKLVAGQPATLAVVDAEGRLTPGVVVEFTGGGRVTTGESGRALFLAPQEQGVLMAHSASNARASAVVLSANAAADAPAVSEPPRVLSTADPFSLSGAGFSGYADENSITLGGQAALVLAASPVSLVAIPASGVEPGAAELALEVNGRKHAALLVTLVALEVEVEPRQIGPGKKGTLRLRARGTDLPMELAVANASPRIIEFPGKETRLRVTTRGGADNVAVIELKGRAEGDYAVEVRLVAVAAGLPDVATARKELLAARAITEGDRARRLDRILRHLEEHPQHYLDTRHELELILAEAPQGEYARRIQAAWLALLKKTN